MRYVRIRKPLKRFSGTFPASIHRAEARVNEKLKVLGQGKLAALKAELQRIARFESAEMGETMIRKCTPRDFDEIFNIINDAAIAYKGVIPTDRWHEPYMTKAELQAQLEEGVRFFCYVDRNEIIGVMGI